MRMRARAIDQIQHPEYQRRHIVLWRDAKVSDKYLHMAQQQRLWVLGPAGNPLASAGLRLNTLELVAVFVDPDYLGNGYAQRLVRRVEHAAAGYGITSLLSEASLNAVGFYRHLGYRDGKKMATCDRLGLPCREMHKNLLPRQTHYQQQVLRTLNQLSIPSDYGIRHKLAMQPPPYRLVDAGSDCFGRPQKLTAGTLKAWQKMLNAAADDDIQLQMVSAYRDLAYQTGIIQRKLEQGQSIADILKVSAAPGFSEHHSGRAMDINTPGCRPLETEFSETPAYHWLCRHAGRFGFTQSYPQNNIHDIAWEPWHWCYTRRR